MSVIYILISFPTAQGINFETHESGLIPMTRQGQIVDLSSCKSDFVMNDAQVVG